MIRQMSNYLMIVAAVAALASGAGASRPTDGKAREIAFTGAKGLRLSGTLLIPAAKGSVPAILLLPGSGPTDRDGNAAGLQIDLLKQIAERLAKEGYASFRFDKRAVARYQADWPKTTAALNHFFAYGNFIGDAETAYETLRKQPGIDPKHVGVLGHSEGGLYALQIAADTAGTGKAPHEVILVSTAGRKLSDVIHDQIVFRTSLPPTPEALAQKLVSYTDRACAALAAGKPLPPNEPVPLKGLFNDSVIDLLTAYTRIDPCDLAKKYKGPVLVLNGSADTQVSPAKDAKRLFETLKGRSSGSAKLLIVPKVSHNMKSTAGGNRDAFLGPVVPPALDAIASFLKSTR